MIGKAIRGMRGQSMKWQRPIDRWRSPAAAKEFQRMFKAGAGYSGDTRRIGPISKRRYGIVEKGQSGDYGAFNPETKMIEIEPELDWADKMETFRHEAVHRAVDKVLGKYVHGAGYHYNRIWRYFEEARAEYKATRDIVHSAKFPMSGYGIDSRSLFGSAQRTGFGIGAAAAAAKAAYDKLNE